MRFTAITVGARHNLGRGDAGERRVRGRAGGVVDAREHLRIVGTGRDGVKDPIRDAGRAAVGRHSKATVLRHGAR